MKQPQRTRRLCFEVLERKASPSALLLLVAPLDEESQALAEQVWAAELSQAEHPAGAAVARGSSAVLQFIEEGTHETDHDDAPQSAPSVAQCRVAEEMLQATDSALRAMIRGGR